jgi:aminoglycoside phosphotransferase family enzyme
MPRTGAAKIDVIQAMAQSSFYPHRPGRVQVEETHISWIFLAGGFVYKVKKPVRLPFVDYGTLERRRRMCEEEVRLNRRLAEGTYLGVRPIVETGDGLALGSGEDRGVVEWTVEMRRLPGHRALDRLVERGHLTAAHMRAVAHRLARFHAEADVVQTEMATVAQAKCAIEDNLDTLLNLTTSAVERQRLLAAKRFSDTFFRARTATFSDRAARGRVRDGHGDLRLEHVVMTDGVQIFDCVEFDPALRQIDVGADLAFLIMDLVFHDADELADKLVHAYRRVGGDPGDDAFLTFYCAYRALVRAKVGRLRVEQIAPGSVAREAALEEAARLVDLAERFRWRARHPLVLAICGITASGKTTLAEAIGKASGLPVISSDTVRKRLAGIAPTARAAPEHYNDAFSRRTYRELGKLAAAELEQGRGVIIDATFRRRADREAFQRALGPISLPVLFVECWAPIPLLAERARSRERVLERTSDATVELVDRQLDEFEPLDELRSDQRVVIDTDREITDIVDQVETFLDSRLDLLAERRGMQPQPGPQGPAG